MTMMMAGNIGDKGDILWSDPLEEELSLANLANWWEFGNPLLNCHWSKLLSESRWWWARAMMMVGEKRIAVRNGWSFVKLWIVWQGRPIVTSQWQCLCTFLQPPKNCNSSKDPHILISGNKKKETKFVFSRPKSVLSCESQLLSMQTNVERTKLQHELNRKTFV